MSLYLAVFELQHDSDYDGVRTVLDNYEDSWRACGSAWCVETDESVSAIRDRLAERIGHADRVLVTAMGEDWAANNIKDVDWLNEHD